MKENVTQLEFDSKAEEIVYEYLKSVISLENYTIEMHCSIFDVLNCEQKELIDKYRHFCLLFLEDEELQQSNFIKNDISQTHFDFVIFTKEFHMPVLFIEVDGSSHYTIPGKIIMDSFKLALSQSKSIPLVHIPLYKMYKKEEIHVMVQQVLSGVNIRKVLPAYCPQCGNKLLMRKNGKTNANFYICDKCKSIDETKDKTYNLNSIPLILI